MNSFYYIRHGMTDANCQKLLCGGDWDISLNDEGHAQAERAAVEYVQALADIRTICSSPLLRARQTAEYFAKELKVPLVVVDDLKEQGLGEWERQPWQDVPDFFAGTRNPPNGESLDQLDARIQRGLQVALRNDGPVLIVSHGAVWYSLHRIFGIQPEPPGSCVAFQFEQKNARFNRTRLIV